MARGPISLNGAEKSLATTNSMGVGEGMSQTVPFLVTVTVGVTVLVRVAWYLDTMISSSTAVTVVVEAEVPSQA
jgi:hypothetical protein